MKTSPPTFDPTSLTVALSPKLIGSTAEILEARIAPAMITAPAVFSYTDTDGDVVKVKVAGTGTVEFLDAAQMDVSTVVGGANIATIVVRNPDKNFALTFADTNPATGDNVIELGKIAGAGGARLPVIKGVFTIDSAMSVTYNLGGYIGTDFADGGGLQILGGVTQPGVGGSSLDLQTLKPGRTVSLRDGIAADGTVMVAGDLGGHFLTGGSVAGAVVFGSVSGAARFLEVPGSVTISGDLSGRLSVTGGVGMIPSGLIEVDGSLTSTARVNAGALHLDVAKNVSGDLEVAQNLTLSVGKNLKDAIVLGGANATVNVGASVTNSSIFVQGAIGAGSAIGKDVVDSEIAAGTDLTLDIGAAAAPPNGSLIHSRLSSGSGKASISIAGVVTESEIVAGGSANIDIGGNVSGSSILPDGNVGGGETLVTVNIGGDVDKSQIGTLTVSLDATIAGGVIASKLLAGHSMTASVGRSVSRSEITAGSTLDATVTGDVVESKLVAGSTLNATVGGSVVESKLIAVRGQINAAVDGKVADSKLTAASTMFLSSGGNVVRSQLMSGSTIDVSIGGSVKKSALLAANALIADVAGDLVGSRLSSVDVGNVGVDGAELTIGRIVTKTTIYSGQGVTIASAVSVGSDVIIHTARDANLSIGGEVGARISAAGNVTVTAGGSFTGSVNAGQSVQFDLGDPGNAGAPLAGVATTREIRAGGNFSLHSTGKVQARHIEIGGSVVDFSVGGKLDAPLHVAGDFFVGSNNTTSAMVIGGKVTASTLIEIDGNLGGAMDSAAKLVFGDAFAGRLAVGGRLLVDLEFDGPVSTLGFAAGIGRATAGDNIAQIVVNGKLDRLTSGSLFKRTSTNGGDFVDGAGTTTGSIAASGGAPVIEPGDFS
jgi:hypothetical protein